MMAEVIKSKQEYLPLDISSLANKHREVNEGHVVALLAMRGDMSKAQVTKMLQSTVLGKVEDEEGEGARPGRRREEKNVLAQISVKNHWALLK
jgi:hypothetical protein